MKLNLLISDPKNIRNGYVNVDPFADGSDCRTANDVSNLDKICSDNEATEIIAHSVLEYFPIYQTEAIVNNWLNKLSHEGTLTIIGVDVEEVASKYSSGFIETVSFCREIYGEQKENWQIKKSGLTLSDLVKWLKGKGLEILKARIDNFNYVVVAKRP